MNKMLRRSGQPLISLWKKMWKTYGKDVNTAWITIAFTGDKVWINKKEVTFATSFRINLQTYPQAISQSFSESQFLYLILNEQDRFLQDNLLSIHKFRFHRLA